MHILQLPLPLKVMFLCMCTCLDLNGLKLLLYWFPHSVPLIFLCTLLHLMPMKQAAVFSTPSAAYRIRFCLPSWSLSLLHTLIIQSGVFMCSIERYHLTFTVTFTITVDNTPAANLIPSSQKNLSRGARRSKASLHPHQYIILLL
jgi:hypothetical protein